MPPSSPFCMPCNQGKEKVLLRKIRVGVVGVGRGRSMIDYCLAAGNAELAEKLTVDHIKNARDNILARIMKVEAEKEEKNK